MKNLSEGDWLKIVALLNEINMQTDNQALRKLFLDRIGDLIDFDIAIFDLSKFENGKFDSLCDPVLKSEFSTTFEKQFINDYDSKYFRMSYLNWVYFQEKNIVYRESDIIDIETKKKSQFYQEFLEPRGILHACGCNLVYNKLCIGGISFARTKDKEDFTDRDLFIIKQFQPHIITKLIQHIDLSQESDFKEKLIAKYNITSREMEIINLIFHWHDNKEISEILNISINTVKKHTNNIFSKLDVKNRGQLIYFLNAHDYFPE